MDFWKTTGQVESPVTKKGPHDFTMLEPNNDDGIVLAERTLIMVDFGVVTWNVLPEEEFDPEEDVPGVELRLDSGEEPHGQDFTRLQNGRQTCYLRAQLNIEAEGWERLVLQFRNWQGARYKLEENVKMCIFTP